MTTRLSYRHSTAVALAALTFTHAVVCGQTTPGTTTPPAATGEDIVVLSVFEVSTNQTARYQADQTASGGRIRTDIMDTPTTVTVLTRDLIEDVGTLRVLDVAKYVAGVSEATIPNALDRVNIRGFQSDGRRVDGFSTADQANYDAVGIERMEIIKGPDALLQPAGIPGGTINLVTKTPKFTRAGSLTFEVGQYDSNRVEADITGPVGESKDLAYRFVTAYHNSDGYVQRTGRKSFYALPSLTWKLAPGTTLTMRYEYYNFESNNTEGIPVDPSVGTNSEFKLLAGVPHNFSPALEFGDRQYRRVQSHTGSFILTSTVADRLSVRLAGRYAYINTPDRGFGWGFVGSQGGARDPLTGLWVGGSIFASTAPYAASPATPQSRIFAHTGTDQEQKLEYRDLQNDWAYSLETSAFKSVTSVGLAYAFEYQKLNARTMTARSFSPDNFTIDNDPVAFGPFTTVRRRQLTRMQAYVNEQVKLLNDRVILSAGATSLQFNGYFGNKVAAATPTSVYGQMYPGDGTAHTFNYGIVGKPLENLSVYYGHSESAVPQSNFQSVAQGAAPRISEGIQDEVGLKVQLLDKRLIASVSYYEIDQTGYSLANPANLTSPPPSPLLPALILTRFAKGWEYQVTAGITKDLSLIAGYADTKNRDPNNIPFRSSAEKMGSIYLRYEFSDGALKGFGAGIGVNYMGERAGDVATGYTAASTVANPIPNQPSFYLPAQTLADLNLSYTREKWTFRFNVMNLFDKENYPASGARNIVYVGNPRNFSGSATWRF